MTQGSKESGSGSGEWGKLFSEELFVQAPCAIAVVVGIDHVFEYANPLYAQLTRVEVVVGKTIREVHPQLLGQGIFEILDDVYHTRKSVSVQEKCLAFTDCGDSTPGEVFVDFVFHPYKRDGVEGVLIFATNVTEQVQTRKKLELANEEITRLFNTVNEGFFSRDVVNNRYFHLSSGCEKIYGYSAEDFLSNCQLWFDVIHPEDREIVLKDDELLKQAQPARSEYRIIHKNGTVRWIEVRVVPVLKDGVLSRVEGIVSDVTERKAAELEIRKAKDALQRQGEMLSHILNSIPQCIFWKDENSVYLGCNTVFAKAAGFDHPSLIVGKTDFDLPWKKDEALKYRKDDEEVIKSRTPKMNFIETQKQASGRMVWTQTSKLPLTGLSGQVYGLLGIYEDITERKRQEEEREKITADLIQRNIDLKQFSYIVSHNLRAPITKILGLASILEGEKENNEVNAELIRYIAEATVNLDNVVKDINTIVSSQDPGIKVKEQIHFETELKLITQSLEHEIGESGARIKCNFEDPSSMESVRSYFYSIMFNLVSNAIKYRSPERPLTITLNSSQSEHFICISVKDNGIGIDMERYGEKVFGLYNRFHNGPIPGRGIGLNLVKTQAEALGGRVELVSAPGQGSEFKVFFPHNHQS